MKPRVGIITSDDAFYNRIRLILRLDADTVRVMREDLPHHDCDVIFADLRTGVAPLCDCVTFGDAKDISIPFTHEAVIEAFRGALSHGAMGLTLSDDGKHARLLGRPIPLTKLEYRLLFTLFEAGDVYISAEELLKRVWGGERDGGIVTVYMHYLRKKLEAGGERVILTKRDHSGASYKIDERYRRR